MRFLLQDRLGNGRNGLCMESPGRAKFWQTWKRQERKIVSSFGTAVSVLWSIYQSGSCLGRKPFWVHRWKQQPNRISCRLCKKISHHRPTVLVDAGYGQAGQISCNVTRSGYLYFLCQWWVQNPNVAEADEFWMKQVGGFGWSQAKGWCKISIPPDLNQFRPPRTSIY